MSKFNKLRALAGAVSPIKTQNTATGQTFEGAPGHARDAKSELFLLAVTNMVGEDTFYEVSTDRDERFRTLVAEVALSDPDWLGRMIAWLRSGANLRSASVVAAAEMVAARLAAGHFGGNRAVISSALQRPDEPGELLAYWISRYGRSLPQPVKRGVADAAVRLYTERALAKYDTDSHAFRFADVLELTHPTPKAAWQGQLFKHAIDRRHGRAATAPTALRTLAPRSELLAIPVQQRRAVLTAPGGAQRLATAGMTWEAVAGWSQGPMDATAWEAVIPSMGYMALLRNLRNFDEAGVSNAVASAIAARLSDPDEVARSRQMPLRFLAAYRAAPSLRWASALDSALTASLAGVPSLSGRTLVLVDRSGSMFGPLSARSQLNRADAAALFGTALAVRADKADLVQFGTGHFAVRFRSSESVLRVLDRFGNLGGTNTADAVRSHYQGHDRVVILTDEQAWSGYRGESPTSAVPDSVPVYTWNLAGYRYGHGGSGSGQRHTFGGLTDAAFSMIGLIEAGRAANWPF